MQHVNLEYNLKYSKQKFINVLKLPLKATNNLRMSMNSY